MKALSIVLMAPLLFTAGCGGPAYHWYLPEGTFEQAKRDYSACKRCARREASQAVADEYIDRAASPRPRSRSYSTSHNDLAFGADPFDAWSTWGQMYQDNVFAGCMKRKGYQRLKAHRLPCDVRTKSLSMGAIAGR